MQIKVNDTRIHKKIIINHNDFDSELDVLVAEGKLVLVECKPEEALLFKSISGNIFVKTGNGLLVKTMGTYYRSITISKTEKIEVGDKVLNHAGNIVHIHCYNTDLKVFQYIINGALCNIGVWDYKILTLPEHFSPKYLQDIVDGKMKDGDKVLVECEDKVTQGYSFSQRTYHDYVIKLNSSNHITLHKVEEKMYTQSVVEAAFKAGEERGLFIDELDRTDVNHLGFDEWFKTQNIS